MCESFTDSVCILSQTFSDLFVGRLIFLTLEAKSLKIEALYTSTLGSRAAIRACAEACSAELGLAHGQGAIRCRGRAVAQRRVRKTAATGPSRRRYLPSQGLRSRDREGRLRQRESPIGAPHDHATGSAPKSSVRRRSVPLRSH
jgi:hypothetical protein